MTSVGRRRAELPSRVAPPEPGRRVAHRRPRPSGKYRTSPAMFGAVALLGAGLGSFATANVDSDLEPSQQTAADAVGLASPADKVNRGDNDTVDVSRSFDRAALGQQVAAQARQRARALKESDSKVAAQASKLEQERLNQWVSPIVGYTLTARFGQRSGLWSSGMHTGLDFAGPSGTPIVAVAAGTVTSAGYSGSYGNRTVITLRDGTEVWYCHQSQIVVRVGEAVLPGQLTGYTGATGNVTGPHLHVEIRPLGSGPVDPATAMRSHGVEP